MDFALPLANVISHVTSMIRTIEMNHKDMRFFISLLSETPLYIWYFKNFVTLDVGKQASHSRSFFLFRILHVSVKAELQCHRVRH